MNFLTFLQDLAIEHKNRIAVSDDNTTLTYKELFDNAKAFATGLRNRGLRTGNKVGLLMYNSSEFVVAFFGTVFAGGVVVPINPFFVPEEVEYILRHSESTFFITSKHFSEYIDYVNKNIEDIELIISADCKSPSGKIVKFKDIYNPNSGYLPSLTKDEPLAIMYSSGTEGQLKGALMSHDNLLSNAISMKNSLEILQTDKMVTFLPLFHPFSFTVGLLMMLSAGGSILLVDNTLPFKKLLKRVFLKRATLFIGIPEVFKLISSIKKPTYFKLINPIRFCISGGSPLPLEVLRAFEEKYKIPIIEGYGLLEAGPVVSINPLNLAERKPGSVGKPIASVKVIILDAWSKKPVANGSIGEIAVKGSGIMIMYYKDPSATKASLHKGWLLTGDIGRFDEDGYLYVLDRKADIIHENGKIIFSRSIEEVLHEHSAIEECAVVGVRNKSNEKVPAAIITLKPNEKLTANDVIKFMVSKNANHIPQIIEFWDDLPRGSTAKILKREIIRILSEKNNR